LTEYTKYDQIIATWFHADSDADSGVYSQTLGGSTRSGHYEVYFRCVEIFFESLSNFKRTEKRLFFTNQLGYEVSSLKFKKKLLDLNVEIVVLENSHIPPQNFGLKWRNQFYLIDILNYLAHYNCDTFIFDSDVIAMSDEEIEFESNSELILLVISDIQDEEINGLQVADIGRLFAERTQKQPKRLSKYYGGEFLGIRGDSIQKFSELMDYHFDLNLEASATGGIYLREEAHLISLVSQEFSVSENGSNLIQRIWTQPWTFRKIPENLEELIFWHLPAEKKTGFKFFYSNMSSALENGWKGMEQEKWKNLVSETFGVRKYTYRKLIRDIFHLRSGLFRHLKNRIIK
jgi:hypothetical protein